VKKIISLFQRNYNGDRLVRNEVTPGAEWVINGEGVPTRKVDGTSCLVKEGELYKRYDSKKGKNPPVGFIPAQDPDPVTGHWPGWLKVGTGNEDKWHNEGYQNIKSLNNGVILDGTYELVGPKVQGNPENYDRHMLLRHDSLVLVDDIKLARDFESIKNYLEEKNKSSYFEGIVFHHSDGRMVKIKAKDFGIKTFKGR